MGTSHLTFKVNKCCLFLNQLVMRSVYFCSLAL